MTTDIEHEYIHKEIKHRTDAMKTMQSSSSEISLQSFMMLLSPSLCVFTFSHLADTFIQSDLQLGNT